MKKTIFKSAVALLFVTCPLLLSAQMEKGMFRLSGRAEFYTSSSVQSDTVKEYKTSRTSISFAPSIGYFISNKTCVGLEFPLEYAQYGTAYKPSGNESKSNTIVYGVNPYIRSYKTVTEKLYGYLQVNAGVILRNDKNSSNNGGIETKDKREFYGYSAGANLGLAYFVTPRLALEASLVGLRYTANYSKLGVTKNRESSFGFTSFINSINLGLSFFIK